MRASRRASRPLQVVTSCAVLGTILLSGLYVVTDKTAHRVNAQKDGFVTTSPRVSLLSARRAPNTLSVVTRTGRLSRAVTDFLPQVPSQGCVAVDWMGDRIGQVRSDTSFIPASATKMVVAAVALELLGPTFTFETNVHATLDANGVAADLYLVGGGDPILIRSEYPSTEKYPTTSGTSLEALADAVVSAGVKQVSGSIVGIDGRYDDKRYVDVWPDDFHSVEAGPLGALMVDDGMVMGENMKPDDPAISAATELRVLLEARGVGVGGLSRRDTSTNNAASIAKVTSAPLTAVVSEMLVNSDNNTAELLLKELGFAKEGVGSTDAGLKVVMSTLKEWKIDKDVVLFDGSGLASENRLSCDVFMSLLTRFDTSLPTLMATAGQTGTIRDAFTDQSLNGILRGKTGTLNGVKSLVGYVPIENTDPVIFSLMINKTGIDNKTAYRPIWYALSDALSRAKATPRADQLVP
jgi:D-alanyl-D-alanine carboxypeptidase/D-alanyl-D-alanine-endopeptidase (penicillin-binding protein 4)